MSKYKAKRADASKRGTEAPTPKGSAAAAGALTVSGTKGDAYGLSISGGTQTGGIRVGSTHVHHKRKLSEDVDEALIPEEAKALAAEDKAKREEAYKSPGVPGTDESLSQAFAAMDLKSPSLAAERRAKRQKKKRVETAAAPDSYRVHSAEVSSTFAETGSQPEAGYRGADV